MSFGIEVTFADFCLYIAQTPGNKALSLKNVFAPLKVLFILILN